MQGQENEEVGDVMRKSGARRQRNKGGGEGRNVSPASLRMRLMRQRKGQQLENFKCQARSTASDRTSHWFLMFKLCDAAGRNKEAVTACWILPLVCLLECDRELKTEDGCIVIHASSVSSLVFI